MTLLEEAALNETRSQRNLAQDMLAHACGAVADLQAQLAALQKELAAAQARIKELEPKPPTETTQ